MLFHLKRTHPLFSREIPSNVLRYNNNRIMMVCPHLVWWTLSNSFAKTAGIIWMNIGCCLLFSIGHSSIMATDEKIQLLGREDRDEAESSDKQEMVYGTLQGDKGEDKTIWTLQETVDNIGVGFSTIVSWSSSMLSQSTIVSLERSNTSTMLYFISTACVSLVVGILVLNDIGMIFIGGIPSHTCRTPANVSSQDNTSAVLYYPGRYQIIQYKFYGYTAIWLYLWLYITV